MNQTTVISTILALIIGYIGGTVLQPKAPAATGGHQSMQHMMDDMAAALTGKTGVALDKAFLEEMIPHHEGAVVMAQMIKTGSDNAELLKMADAIIETQSQEIDQMNTWLREWFTEEHEGMSHGE